MSEKLRIVFMGSPDFALPSLEKLYETYGVTAVFCQPDKASGRGNERYLAIVGEQCPRDCHAVSLSILKQYITKYICAKKVAVGDSI